MTAAWRCKFVTSLTDEETEVEKFVQAAPPPILLLHGKGKMDYQDCLMPEIMFFSTNGAGATGYPHTEESSWTPTSSHTHRLTQNGSWAKSKSQNYKKS